MNLMETVRVPPTLWGILAKRPAIKRTRSPYFGIQIKNAEQKLKAERPAKSNPAFNSNPASLCNFISTPLRLGPNQSRCKPKMPITP